MLFAQCTTSGDDREGKPMNKLPILSAFVYITAVLNPGPCVAADLYKWTDAQGQVHYGDDPHKGAKRLPNDAVQSYSPPRRSTHLSPKAKDKSQGFTGYSEVTIVNPQADETIWDNEGGLAVRARVEPGLQSGLGHKLQFLLDGQPAGAAEDSVSMTLTEIERGSHSLSAIVVDGDGKQLARAPSINFHIKKVSRLQRSENLHGRRR
jgi:hypothetical protein